MKQLLDAASDAPAFMQKGPLPVGHAAAPSVESKAANIKSGQAESCSAKEEAEAPVAQAAVDGSAEDVAEADSTAEGFGKKELLRTITAITEAIEKDKLYLTELDNVIGDGDHGINMARGFQAVMVKMDYLRELDCAGILSETGKTLLKMVGGSSGPLYGTAFRKAGEYLNTKSVITLMDLVDMLDVSIKAIQKLGKAKEGEKTLLDSMEPAYRALKAAAEEGKDAKTALELAVKAAEEGVA